MKRKAAEMGAEGIVVMMNGLPGAMGHEVSAACMRRGMQLAPIALTGAGCAATVQVSDGNGGKEQEVRLLDANTDGVDEELKALVAEHGSNLIAIDFTHPTAVNANATRYAKHKINFVMGTTGGDREALMETTTSSGVCAVIAANMCKQIVALTATLKAMATQFPGAFSGYTLSVTESHQSGKADTSGTAKDMVQYFQGLLGTEGTEFKVSDIVKLRESPKQLAFGVPEDALKGHAFHTYTLKSADNSVSFQFQHNVCGRRTYAEGVCDAVQFLAGKVAEGDGGKKVFDMIDVLSAGAMQ